MKYKNLINTNPQGFVVGGTFPGVRPLGAQGGDENNNPNATFTIYKRDAIRNQFNKYVKELNIALKTDLKDNDPSSQKEKILLACIRDFVNYEIDFDLFVSIFGILWITDGKKFDFHLQTEVEELCYSGCELQWYLRNEPEKHINWLTEILNYYKKNKTKLKNIET